MPYGRPLEVVGPLKQGPGPQPSSWSVPKLRTGAYSASRICLTVTARPHRWPRDSRTHGKMVVQHANAPDASACASTTMALHRQVGD